MLTVEIIRKWLKILNEKYLALPDVDDQKKVEGEQNEEIKFCIKRNVNGIIRGRYSFVCD